jgi:hypothetical protein
MVEFRRHEPEKSLSGLDVPSPGEIQEIIGDMVRNYDGDELIQRLSEFCILNMIEVMFTQDQSPVPLQRLDDERLEIVQKLLKAGAESEDFT